MMTIIKFAGFVAVILFLLFGTHFLLYSSIIRFFEISGPSSRKTIMWIMFFLVINFFASVFLLRFHVNIFSSLLYFIACLWLGLFLHFLMALVLIWFLFGAGKLIGSVPDMRMIATGILLVAAVISIYGLWRAHNPELKRLEVKIEGLPDHWKNRTVVHLSDLHLGTINRTGFMEQVAVKVNRVDPDLILITGDLFDGMGGDLYSFVEPLRALKASKGIFFVTGNHEGYLGLKEPLSVLKATDIRVLDDEIVDLEGLQIVGISFPEHDREKSVRHLLTRSGLFDAGKPSILMYHTPTNIAESNTDRGSQQTKTYWYPDTTMALAKEAGIDLQLSGHTHQGQLFPFGWLTRAIYSGYDYGLHRDGTFQIYITSGVGTWGPPIRTGGSSEIVVIQLR
jgi:predicted MPP superfamily phosphohydrolase